MSRFFAVFIIVALTFWLRLPSINYGMPYFYNEDEAHHFNRLTNMFKSGDMNPHYFLKPSLHFYLRLPVTAAAYFWEEKQGGIESKKEIDTRDRFGLAKYAFSASHPRLVKWNRAYSLFISIAIAIAAFLIAFQFTGSFIASLTGALIFCLSPPLVLDSAIIGVEPFVGIFCILSTLFAIRYYNKPSTTTLFLLSACCGLACSSKYNAAPIAFLPLFVCLLTKTFTKKELLIAVFMPVIFFILGTPYLLVSFPLFLEHVKYELWHYAVAGHVGHTGSPGIDQIVFYLDWFIHDAVGLGAVCVLLASIVHLEKKHLPLLFFPLAYFIMMCAQKANFTRNMYVLIPYVGIFVAIEMVSITGRFKKARFPLQLLFAFALLFPLAIKAYARRIEISSITESRTELLNWLKGHIKPEQEVAVAGELQLAPQITNKFPVSVFSQQEINIHNLFQQGFSYVITYEPAFTLSERIILNPLLSIVNVPDIKQLVPVPFDANCEPNKEGYCWITNRSSKILQSAPIHSITFEAMSPWQNQSLKVSDNPSTTLVPNIWKTFNFPLNDKAIEHDGGVLFLIDQVHSPALLKLSPDERRLGVAIKNVTFQ
jgi:hypothetical protein